METTAQEIMSRELITIREGDSVEAALKTLVHHRVTGLPVVDARGRMVGIVSEFDLIRQLSRHRQLTPAAFHEPIEFTRKPQGVRTDAPLSKVVKTLLEARVRRIPVWDRQRKLVGIITRRDLMRVFYYRAKLGDVSPGLKGRVKVANPKGRD
jgi:CBS domain-containing protein